MNSWELHIEFRDGRVTDEGGVMDDDFFKSVIGDGNASISVNVGHSLGYGNAKCSATVRVTCNQDAKTMDTVAERVFQAAKNYADEGMRQLAAEIGSQ